jgi:hypothetical protein
MKERVRLSSVKNEKEGRIEFTPEFLNSVEIADLSPYELKLKNDTIICGGAKITSDHKLNPWFRTTHISGSL